MTKFQIPTIVISAINHLISAEKWAHQLLLKHDHQIINLIFPFFEFSLLVKDGFFTPEIKGQESSVSIEVSQEAIWAFFKDGKPAAMKFVKVSGDVDFAADLNRLVADLKWEAEEDLATIIGDGPANMFMKESKKMMENGQKASKDLRMGIRDYFVDERQVLLGRDEFDQFKSDIRVVRDHLERVEKMVVQLSQIAHNKVGQ
jgi:ubiquinone biosynthesis protein UbiJ